MQKLIFKIRYMKAKFYFLDYKNVKAIQSFQSIFYCYSPQPLPGNWKSHLETELPPVFYKQALFPHPQLEHPSLASPAGIQNTKFNIRYLAVPQGVLYCIEASNPPLIRDTSG